jgi:hypothetical protein
MRLIDADALRQKIERWENETNKRSSFSDSVKGFTYDEALDAIDTAPTLEAVQWHDGLPPEHDSIFAQYNGTSKWGPYMFKKTSKDVLVTIEHKSGARMTVVAKTIDGEWKNIPLVNEVKVVAWAKIPAPKEG